MGEEKQTIPSVATHRVVAELLRQVGTGVHVGVLVAADAEYVHAGVSVRVVVKVFVAPKDMDHKPKKPVVK